MGRLKRQRKKLWEENPYCHWCGKLTRLIELDGHHQPDDMATIDHINSKYSPQRLMPSNGELRRVIACFRCNNDRAAKEQKEIPIEELQLRSQQHKRKKANKFIQNYAVKLNWAAFQKELEELPPEEQINKVNEIYQDFFSKADSIEAIIENYEDLGDIGFLIKAETVLKKARRHLQLLQELNSKLRKKHYQQVAEEKNRSFERRFMWIAKKLLSPGIYDAIMKATKEEEKC